MKKKMINTRRLTIKLILCAIYLCIITILLVGSYKLFEEKNKIIPWEEVKTANDYSYIEVSKMSEKFAYYENENIGLHFIIEEKDTGEWHTYVIAINEDEYGKFKDIIDYSYERTEKVPDKVKIYGYATIMGPELKDMIVRNIKNFLPADNEVVITNENIDHYLTNSYLDTTKKKKETFSILLFSSLLLLFLMTALVIFTIFDKDNIGKRKEKISKLEKQIGKMVWE